MPRKTALEALERCRRGGAWSSQTLSTLLERRALDSRDAAFCSRLFLGTLQNLYYLDFCIDRCARGKLEPKLRDILRLGAYQLLFMDRVPAVAAVNESVKLCKACGYTRAAGLVNAVLRRLSSEGTPEIPGEGSASYLSIRWSHPLPLVEELISLRGYEGAAAVLALDNEAAPTYIQTNYLRTTPEALAERLGAEPFAGVPGCLVFPGGAVAGRAEFQDGLFYVQDPAARAAVYMAGVKPGMRILDACAAPGGKSFAAAMDMRDEGEIVSCDVSGAKLALVADGAERMGLSCIDCRVRDAREIDEGLFDLVIADVPCSGLGVIRKKPEIRYRDAAEAAGLPALQGEILRHLSASVAPGGSICYCTCTWREAENSAVTHAFLAENKDFEMEQERTFWPDLDGTDGFYSCRMRRKSGI